MSTNPLPRIFFDTNEGTHAQGYLLVLPLSLRDLAAIHDLHEGQEVLLYMPNDLEMRAHIRLMAPAECAAWNAADGSWIAEPIPGTVRHCD
jgi:hypothetical protein